MIPDCWFVFHLIQIRVTKGLNLENQIVALTLKLVTQFQDLKVDRSKRVEPADPMTISAAALSLTTTLPLGMTLLPCFRCLFNCVRVIVC